MSERRRTLMTAAASGGLDVISGTVTATAGKLVLPIPRGYYFLATLITDRSLSYGDLPELGFFYSASAARWWSRKIPTTGNGSIGISSGSATPPWWISVSDLKVTVNATNNNTSGVIRADDEYFYIAWKEV